MSGGSQIRLVMRRVAAVLAGLIANVVLSIGTDFALSAAGVFPSLSKPESFTTPMWLLATAYRTVYGIGGSYLAALLAPDHPLGHAITLGVLGFFACVAGAVTMWGVGPHWYPLALVVLAIPSAWIGGRLRLRQVKR
jgi:hypothetical protein